MTPQELKSYAEERTCQGCATPKPLTAEFFYPVGKHFKRTCKACVTARVRKRWRDDPNAKVLDKAVRDRKREQIRAYDRMRAKRDRAKKEIIVKRWVANNPERHKEFSRRRVERWQSQNPHKVRAQNALRAKRIRQAMPRWLTKEQRQEIRQIYQAAGANHVDHIVPLRGRNVCGLHVPWNLQHLEPAENRKKHNHHAD